LQNADLWRPTRITKWPMTSQSQGRAYIGNRGAKELLELVFPKRTESELTGDGTCVTRD
jgi:hypothetical protein